MIETRVRFNYQDYLCFPKEKRCEIIDGEVLMSPAPTTYHQRVLLNLYRIIDAFVRARKLGEVLIAPCDVLLSEFDVVQPDILFVSTARLGIIGPRYISAPPDLVVELFTEPSAYRDLVVKKRLYAKYGLPEYWLVDLQAKEIEILAPAGSGYETIPASKVLSGLIVRPADIF